jgi:hypothetical protein
MLVGTNFSIFGDQNLAGIKFSDLPAFRVFLHILRHIGSICLPC